MKKVISPAEAFKQRFSLDKISEIIKKQTPTKFVIKIMTFFRSQISVFFFALSTRPVPYRLRTKLSSHITSFEGNYEWWQKGMVIILERTRKHSTPKKKMFRQKKNVFFYFS
jgi:hypothetical protein